MARVRVEAAVTGWGLQCALGTDPVAVAAALDAGESAVAPHPDLDCLPGGVAASVGRLPLRDWLRRRKDAKLLARPAALALCAAGPALGERDEDRLEIGLFVGVGQEPPDRGESAPALAASARDGRLDEARLASVGRELYPPLLPLRTLPNMALAHVSIHLGVGGVNGAWAGEAEAGLHALRAAMWALAEGRCAVALAGACDSHADLGNARDLRRRGILDPPGEAAAFLRLEPPGAPGERCRLQIVDGLDAAARDRARGTVRAHVAGLGRCGAADGALAVILAMARRLGGGPATVVAAGEPPVFVAVP
ncbi:MAG: hypothetical protein D6798_08980 [Deltaproteobacteria bacterium]|nr:MAG: hypothetical protein D6798_08980 [Deltaproteobacteria bacterium]